MQESTVIEPFGVPDIYVSGLADIEELAGGNFRFTFYTRQKFAGRCESVAVAKLVIPISAVAEILKDIAREATVSVTLSGIFAPGLEGRQN